MLVPTLPAILPTPSARGVGLTAWAKLRPAISNNEGRARQFCPPYAPRGSAAELAPSGLEDFEHEAERVLLDAPGGGRAADGVEDLAVPEAVIRKSLDSAVLVEIDRDDPAVDFFLRQKRGLLGALRYIVEHLAADGGDRRGRAKHDQHLLLGGAKRKLLERTFRDHVAMMVDLRTAADRHSGEERRPDGYCMLTPQTP